MSWCVSPSSIVEQVKARNFITIYCVWVVVIYALMEMATHTWTMRKKLVVIHPSPLWFLSDAAEGLGLAILRQKIQTQGSVCGISGQTMSVFLAANLFRAAQFPSFQAEHIDFMAMAIKLVQLTSLALQFDVARCVFHKFRASYDVDSDRIQMRWVIAGSIFFALLYRPKDSDGREVSYAGTFFMNVDIIALLPQVFMMAQQSSFVPSPIAHYVVATGMSRVLDLWIWCEDFSAFSGSRKLTFSFWYIITLHVISLAVVSDFFYYYFKTLMTKGTLSQDIFLDP